MNAIGNTHSPEALARMHQRDMQQFECAHQAGEPNETFNERAEIV